MNELSIAVRLADEGVPLCAIARSLETPSEQVRERLTIACAEGRLLGLPREDWPPGYPRDERAIELSRMIVSNRGMLALAAKQLFGLTVAEAELLLTLLQAPVVRRDAVTSNRTTYVHICHLRQRLAAFGLRITTLWGCGYTLSESDRRRAMDMLLART